jgi:hypothetical protein
MRVKQRATGGINVVQCPICKAACDELQIQCRSNAFVPITLREKASARLDGLSKKAECTGQFGARHKFFVSFH